MAHHKLLKGKRFEQKPKPVRPSPDFQDRCGVEHNARLKLQLYELIDAIEAGIPVPAEYYKSNLDEHGDRMLLEIGVKHLHLGGQGSDVIVYLAEFETWVELLEINTHVHLESEPRGKELKGIFRVAAAAAAGAAAGAAGETLVRKRRRRPRKRRNNGGVTTKEHP